MSPGVLRLWGLMATIILVVAELPGVAAAPIPGGAGPAALAAEERESCARNLKVIYDAIQAYQFDHKDLPNWQSVRSAGEQEGPKHRH
jgi:hypothetical protein